MNLFLYETFKMYYIIDLVPLVVMGITCGVVGYLTKNKNKTLNYKTLAIDVATSTILCILTYLILSYLVGYNNEVRIGVSGLIAFLGLDKAILILERIIGIFRNGKS